MHLGIDAGGTSTRAIVVAADGSCHGYGIAGGGNPVSWGPEAAAREIAAAVRDALAPSPHVVGEGPAGAGVADIGGVAALAMAGGTSFAATEAIVAELAASGVRVDLSVESDLLATFCAGTPVLDGYGVVAGTGAAAIRVAGGTVVASSDGLGWLLGDGGSGFWIGQHAARAALGALDGRGPATVLTDLVLAELAIGRTGAMDASGRPAELQAAVNVLYRWRPVELSRLAAVVFRAAEADDAVAMKILTGARDALAGTLAAVHSDEVTGPIVMGGGIARRLPGLADALRRVARGLAARSGDAADPAAGGAAATPVILVEDGAVGAGVLALRRNGIAVDEPVFRRLSATLADRRAALSG